MKGLLCMQSHRSTHDASKHRDGPLAEMGQMRAGEIVQGDAHDAALKTEETAHEHADTMNQSGTPTSSILPDIDVKNEHAPRESLFRRALHRLRSVPRQTSSPDPPNGGAFAWLQVLLAHLTVFNSFGYINSFGVFQPYYVNTLGLTPSAISWIGSLQIFLVYSLGTLSGRLVDRGYFHLTIATGFACQLLAAFTTASSTRYWHLFLSQGLCQGIGNGLLFCPVVALVSTYFSSKRALALAFVACGGATGGLVFPSIAQSLLFRPGVGFGWTVRIMGFVMLVNAVLVISFTRTRVVLQGVPERTLALTADEGVDLNLGGADASLKHSAIDQETTLKHATPISQENIGHHSQTTLSQALQVKDQVDSQGKPSPTASDKAQRIPPNNPQQSSPNNPQTSTPKNFPSTPKKQPLLQLHFLRYPPYTLFALGVFFSLWGIFYAYYYTRPYALSLGATQPTSFSLLLVLNAAGIPGRLVPALISQHLLGPVNTLVPTVLFGSVLLYAWTAVKSIPALYVWVALFGLPGGGVQSLFPAAAASLGDDLETVGARIGLVFTIVSPACLSGPPIAGALVQAEHGEYLGAQMFGGTVMAVGAALVVAARVKRTGWVWRVKV